jgi:hypothetical protein
MFGQTMEQMSKQGHGALAWAGGLASRNPTAARTVLEGYEVRKAVKGIVPDNEKTRALMDETVGTAFRNSEDTYAMAKDAVMAAYAKLAFDAGKTDGKLDDDLLTKAITLAVGNIVKGRQGEMLIPPRHDMTRSDWRDLVLDRITEADIPDQLRTHNPGGVGEKITADKVRRFGEFTSVGDGRYIVRMLDKDGIMKEILDPAGPRLVNGRVVWPAWIFDANSVLARAPAPAVKGPKDGRRDLLLPPPLPPGARPYGVTPGGTQR